MAGSATSRYRIEQSLARHLAILDKSAAPARTNASALRNLVIVGGERKRDKDRRLARRRQFGDRAGARPADHQVGLGEGGRHVRDEGHDFALQAGFREGRAQLFCMRGPV